MAIDIATGPAALLVAAGLSESSIDPGDEAAIELTRDEALTGVPVAPAVVVRPQNTDEVAAILKAADANGIPVTARGSGTGLSGGCVPRPGGILVSFDRMNRILEVDSENHVAVVQPGVTLAQLEEETASYGLVYPIYPGEMSATLGGNVATNAGGMRAVKYGVTRQQVLGLEVALAGGRVIRTGGKFVKCSSGYDLTQLLVGSEGSLGLVTEATLRLYPRPAFSTTVLAPFGTLEEVSRAVPKIVVSGIGPLILEYIDMFSLAATTANVGLDLGVPEDVRQSALAYLVVMIEAQVETRLEEDVETLCNLLGELGATDVYVLPNATAAKLLDAREKAFWVAKRHGADDIIDAVVPRARMPEYMAQVGAIAADTGSLIAGCGHAGDGNVHLSVFQKDPDVLSKVMQEVLAAGTGLGGAVSAEHGIGLEKKAYYTALEDPVKLELMRSIKRAFDPNGILNPGTIFD